MRTLIVVLAAALAACSSTQFHGTVQGQTLAPKESFFQTALGDRVVVVVIDDSGGLCSAKGNCVDPSSSTLTLTFFGLNPVVPGTYAVGSGVGASFERTDASCRNIVEGGFATSGSIVLSKLVDGSDAEGTFDLTFGGDHVTGQFAASWCGSAAADGGM